MSEKRWVYETNDGAECSVVVKKTTKQPVDDGRGGVIDYITNPAIKLVFIIPGSGGPARCVVDEFWAKHYGYPVEKIVELIDDKIKRGANIHLVQGPGLNEDKKIDASKNAAPGPKVKQGARALDGK